MTQNDGSIATPATESLDTQTRVQLAYAAFARLKECGTSVLKERKPWTELLDRASFARPPSTTENLQYFRINYLIVLLSTIVLCMIMSPQSLFVLIALFCGWVYMFILRTSPLVIGGRTFGEREKLIGMCLLTFVVIFFLTSVGTVLLSSVMLGCAVIALHGATRVPDDLFIDDSQTAPSLWSVLKGEQTGQAQISSIV